MEKKNFEKLRDDGSHHLQSWGFDFAPHTERKSPQVPTQESDIRMSNQNIKFIRENLRFFANTISHKNITNFKSIILLNADSLTLDAQSALRRSIEIYNHTKFFIVTANKSKIIKPIILF
jgi:DNA polymerase III delta prime subunit